MKNRSTLSNSNRLSIRVFKVVWRTALLSALVMVLGDQQLSLLQTDNPPPTFYFSAVEDNFYENPANWSPAYPGTLIESDQRIVIQELAYITGFDLELKGELEVSLGAALFSSAGKMIVTETAMLHNYGEVIFDRISNAGKVTNYMGAKIHVKEFYTTANGVVQNLKSASFIVIEGLYNLGNFRNYSLCAAGEFVNESEYHQLQGGELRVDGKMVNLASLNVFP